MSLPIIPGSKYGAVLEAKLAEIENAEQPESPFRFDILKRYFTVLPTSCYSSDCDHHHIENNEFVYVLESERNKVHSIICDYCVLENRRKAVLMNPQPFKEDKI